LGGEIGDDKPVIGVSSGRGPAANGLEIAAAIKMVDP